MSEAHKTFFPATCNVQPVTVNVARLDDIALQLELAPPLLIKIDVQGFEDRVLAGGEQTIRQADVLIIETSFEPLYEGQLLFDDLYRRLYAWGFNYAGAISQLPSPHDRRLLQADSLFVRNGR